MFNRKYLSFLIFGLAIFLLGGCAQKQTVPQNTEFDFKEIEFDFGAIKQSGGIVKHDFEFQYNGESTVTITGVPASCACTKGKVSKTELKKGDKGILTVEFDPNLHEEPEGKFYKTVSILTEPKLEEEPEVKIWVEIDLDLGPDAYKLKGPHDDEDDDHHDDGEAHADGRKFHVLKPIELKKMLKDKDFFLLDVHIPEQKHIPGTDDFIDYQKVKENADRLPQDKNDKIVVYCRSGSMSRSASQDLVDMGYKNVYDLEGGINAFNSLKSVIESL